MSEKRLKANFTSHFIVSQLTVIMYQRRNSYVSLDFNQFVLQDGAALRM